jgi:hypothetical protein
MMAVRHLEVAHLEVTPPNARGQGRFPGAAEVLVHACLRRRQQAQAAAVLTMAEQNGQLVRLEMQVVEAVDQGIPADFPGRLVDRGDGDFQYIVWRTMRLSGFRDCGFQVNVLHKCPRPKRAALVIVGKISPINWVRLFI